ncbi:MAG: endonuclease/exonuclease/phosphatase family protein [Bacteroidota bacterium]
MSRKPGKKRSNILSSLLWLINLVLAFALLASYLAAYVNPEITTIFAFLGLAYPYLLGINVLFVLLWIIKGRRKLFLSLIVILIGYNHIHDHIQIMPGREASEEQDIIKVLSYNVQNMAHSNIGRKDDSVRDKVFGFLRSQKADIACLQEFSAMGKDTLQMSLTDFPDAFYINYNPKKDYRIDALIILTRIPYHNSGSLSVPGEYHNFGIFIDIIQDGDTIRVYNLHLESIRLQHEDYQFVEDVSKGQAEKETFEEGSKSILRKLHNAYQLRAKQTAVIVASLDQCPYPVIICGDFNDTPLSYAKHNISAGLKDAFVQAGHGMGNTFAGNLPPLRIDFILHSDVFTSYEFEVHKTSLSDHYPVSVYLGFRF